jgi:hypothetical protein
MSTGVHEAAVEDDDLVGGQDRGEPVRDHDRRTSAQQRAQRGLDVVLGNRVQVGGGLVEDQDTRVAQDHPGDRHPPLLPTGQPMAALAHHGVVPVGQCGDEVVQVRGGRGGDQLLVGGVGAGIAQVLGDAGTGTVLDRPAVALGHEMPTPHRHGRPPARSGVSSWPRGQLRGASAPSHHRCSR